MICEKDLNIIEKIANENDVKIELTVSATKEELPKFMHAYI